MFFKPQADPLPRPPIIEPPTISGLDAGSVQTGTEWTRVLTGTTFNSVDPIWNLDGAPTGVVPTDNGDGTYTLVWTPTADDEGANSITVSVSDGVRETTGTIALTVLAQTGEPTLTVQALAMPASVDLTALDYDDYVYYGPGFDSSNTNATARKAGVDPALIGAPTFHVDSAWGYLSDTGRAPFEWTDATPAAVETISAMKGSWIRRAGDVAGKGISIPVTASTSATRKAYVYLGTQSGADQPVSGRLTLTCPGTTTIVLDIPAAAGSGFIDRLYEVTFQAGSEGDLVIKWENLAATGGLTLRAIGVNSSAVTGITSSESIPFTVNEYELLTSTLTYSGSGASMVVDRLPVGATFLDSGDSSGVLSYRPPLGAHTSSVTASVFSAMSGDAVLASLAASYAVSEKTADPPVITAPTWSVVVGAANSTTITATGDTSTGAITFSSPNLPSTATLTPAGALEWGDAAAGDIGSYQITVVATDAKGRQSEATFTANVLSASGGVLTQDSTTEYDAIANQQVVNMTSAGTFSWAHVTKDDAGDVDVTVKSGSDILVEFLPEGETTVWNRSFKPENWPATWTGGDPNASKTTYIRAIASSTANASLKIEPMIGTTQRTVTLYFGYDSAACTIKAAMSDGSAVLADATFNSALAADKQRKVVFAAKGTTAGARLNLEIVKLGATGSVYVTGITVA